MSQNREKKKIALKTVYAHVIRAKLYGVLTVNALEGIMNEIDIMLSHDFQVPIDVFSPRFRRFQNGELKPTSYGDHLDRAAKSLCKDIHATVSIELFNTQAIKKVITSIIRNVHGSEREEMIEWLSQPNDVILKSQRYESLINDTCLYYYKASTSNINEDTLAFVRRSANELMRNKASKDALIKKLRQQGQVSVENPQLGEDMQNSLHLNEIVARNSYVNDMSTVDPSQLGYIIPTGVQ